MPLKTFALLLVSVALAALLTVALAFGLGAGAAGMGTLFAFGIIALLARLLLLAR